MRLYPAPDEWIFSSKANTKERKEIYVDNVENWLINMKPEDAKNALPILQKWIKDYWGKVKCSNPTFNF